MTPTCAMGGADFPDPSMEGSLSSMRKSMSTPALFSILSPPLGGATRPSLSTYKELEQAGSSSDDDDADDQYPVRALPALLLFLGTFVNYATRVNINIAIISMTANASSLCPSRSSGSSVIDANGTEVFCWTENQKSFVKGAFYYGYIFMQIPGGRLSELYGTRIVLGVSTVISTLITLVNPVLASWNVWSLVASRVVMGLVQGVLFPSINPMMIRWTATNEHAKFAALASMGGTFGTIFIYPVSGMILTKYDWQAVFYVSGILSGVWCLLWFFLVTDDPGNHHCIPRAELQYIRQNRIPLDVGSRRRLPICQIICSLPVISIALCGFANDWGLYLLLTEGPNFISSVLGKDIATIGFLSSLPYVGRFTMSQLSSALADYFVGRPDLVSKLTVRRICFGFMTLGPAVGLAVMGFITTDWRLCIAVMIIAFTLNGFNMPAFMNVVDVAPNFTGTVAGITNGFGAGTGFVVPLITSAFTSDNPANPLGWRYLFLLSTLIYAAAFSFYLWAGKVEPQSFNAVPMTHDSDESTFTLNGFNMSAYLSLVDVAPNLRGAIGGITNGLGAATGFAVPLIPSDFTSANPVNPLGWRY
eukprot:maker-scaffold182_size278544-snap-gene-1.27 protein:Tk04809 transcript:maker-scaffold182_size278544-snap-gene-1.27-mRNA-1 annotation:"inorganic phosphate cotransporter"